jgi:hypothetical protein
LSDDQGRQLVRRSTPPASDRPSLERPSLFSGMEEDRSVPVVDDQLQRVRILAALETARQNSAARGARSRAAEASARQWQTRLLLALMLAGVVALFTSFGLILLDRHAQSASMEAAIRDQVLPPGASASGMADNTSPTPPSEGSRPREAGNPLAALIVPASAAPSEAPQDTATAAATIIDAAPPAAGPPVVAIVPPAPTPGVAPALTPAPGPAVATAMPPATVPATASTTTPAPATPRTRVATAAVPRPALAAPAQAPREAAEPSGARPRRGDQDVALIEAMLVHNQRKAASAAPAASTQSELTVALQRACPGLQGAARATCRAKFCVANPKAAACHADPGTP